MSMRAGMTKLAALFEEPQMNTRTRYLTGICLATAVAFVWMHMGAPTTSAQPAAAAPQDPADIVAQSIVTQVVTLKVQDQRGEPRLITGKVAFDRPVLGYWVSLVGVDIKFEGDTEKYINRAMFSVDPFAKIINGKEVEVSGKLGIRDGTGDFDDRYEGSITVAVTAILAR